MNETISEPATETTPSAPSALYRWLGSVPIFVSFGILGWYLARHEQMKELFTRLRVDLPLFTVWAFRVRDLFTNYPVLLLPGMLAPLWLYFGWGSRKPERLFWFSIIAFAVCMLFTVIFVIAPLLPLLKIMDALRKK